MARVISTYGQKASGTGNFFSVMVASIFSVMLVILFYIFLDKVKLVYIKLIISPSVFEVACSLC